MSPKKIQEKIDKLESQDELTEKEVEQLTDLMEQLVLEQEKNKK